MKKGAAIFFSVFYLALTVGAMVNFHYCGGKLSSVKVYSDAHQCCCKTIADKDAMKGCCEDETILVQFDETQQIQQQSQLSYNPVELLAIWNNYFNVSESDIEINQFVFTDLPPPDKLGKYISYSSLIFYA